MNSRIVCIARSLGAGGEEVGRAAAESLGYRYTDEEIITAAAERAGVSPEAVAQAEHTPGLIGRIIEAMGRAPVEPAGWVGPAQISTGPKFEPLIKQVIGEVAAQGNVVIVAHGAGIALAGTEGLLRVYVTASPSTRIERVKQAAALNEREAAGAVRESDEQRKQFLRRFYDISEELPSLYDLIINTDHLPISLAADLLVRAARA